jgi:hypothetical protein
MRRSVALAAALLVAAALAGCGEDTEAYCSSLEDAQADLEALRDGDLARLEETLDRIRQIGGDAPGEIRDDWETLNGALTELTDGLAAAGIDVDDLEGLQADLESGRPPEGVDRGKLLELAAAVQGSFGEMRDSLEAIELHARDECDIQLGS